MARQEHWQDTELGSDSTSVPSSRFNLGKSLVLSKPQTCPGVTRVMGYQFPCIAGKIAFSTARKALSTRAGTPPPRLTMSASQRHYSNVYDA